jgi:serine/threonine protein kinase
MDTLGEKLSNRLASPTGVRVAVPALVALMGIASTLLGLGALRSESRTMANAELSDQAADVGSAVGFALDQAGPIIDRLGGIGRLEGPDVPLARMAPELQDMILAHAGITWVSISYPDGTFRAATREGRDGAIALQESRIDGKNIGGATTAVTWYALAGTELRVVREERTAYDPRTRDFYMRALDAKQRVWTPPYTFYAKRLTGITCAEPVFDETGVLHAIVTVDFDINGMSDFIDAPLYEGSRTLVFDHDGNILAYTLQNGHAPPAPTADRPLRAKDLGDPVISAFFEDPTHAPMVDETRFLTLATPEGYELAAVDPMPTGHAGARAPLRWYVASLASEKTIMAPLHRLEKESVVANGIAVLVAGAIGLLLARNLHRARRDLASAKKSLATAKESLAAAQKEARELGSYKLVALLGAGGQGEVWRAEHRLLARSAAVKLVSASKELEASARERFRREAQALAKMKSRNTIELFDYGVTEQGVFYYVMELLDGLDLETLVRDHGPQPAARVIRFLVQMCSSLGEAHEQGLLHRDVKPANVFVCRAADELDIVKVLDFGLVNVIGVEDHARRSSQSVSVAELDAEGEIVVDANAVTQPEGKLTREGYFLGTLGYMSPEQLRAPDGLDARSDIYALGCVAWWLLTGRVVFDFDDPRVLALAHMGMDPPPVRELVKGWFPEALERIVKSCLSKAPGDRPESARALADALRAIEIPKEHDFTRADTVRWWAAHDEGPVTKKKNAVETGAAEVVTVTKTLVIER